MATKAELSKRATELGIAGRAKMSKDELERTVKLAEAAEAMTELAKAELSEEDLTAGARGVLQLATADAISNAETVRLDIDSSGHWWWSLRNAGGNIIGDPVGPYGNARLATNAARDLHPTVRIEGS